MPTKHELHKYRILKPIAHWLTDSRIWHFHRRAVAAGVAIGLFMGFLPLPIQMLLSAIAAVIVRANLPLALGCTWVSNPLTMPPIFAFNYYIGSLILPADPNFSISDINLSNVLELGSNILLPLYFGSVVVGLVVAVISYSIIRSWWRYKIVKHHRHRKTRR